MAPWLGVGVSPDIVQGGLAAAGPPDQVLIASAGLSALNATGLDVPITIPGGYTNMVLLAFCYLEGDGTLDVPTIDGGGPMNNSASGFGTTTMVMLADKLAITSGAHTVETVCDLNSHLHVRVEVWANVLSVGTMAAANGGPSTTASVALSGGAQPANTVVTDGCICDAGSGAVTLTPGAGQSATGHDQSVAFGTGTAHATAGGSHKTASGSAITMTETLSSSKEWSIASAPLRHL